MSDTSTHLSIIPYKVNLAPVVATAYNRVVRGVPYCYPVNAEEFAAAAAPATGAQGYRLLRSEAAFVTLEGAVATGFAHVAIGFQDRHAKVEEGLLRCLWYEPGHRNAGQALLEAAQVHLNQHGATGVIAFPQKHRYPFYHLPSAYLSDRLGHVGALLGQNGYRSTHGEVYMDWPNYLPPTPVAPQMSIDVSVEWRQGRGARPGLILSAKHGERQVGVCHSVSRGDYTNAEAVQDWFFTEWIGVEPDVQGKGVGRYLLQRALLEMREAGYRHATISTARHNYRAALFYTNLGFRVVDWTYAYERELEVT